MDDKQIPYFVHEGVMVRMERTIQRLWITTIVLILALIATNLAWFFYDRQMEHYTETTTVTQEAEAGEGDAVNNYVGGDYVESEANDNHD